MGREKKQKKKTDWLSNLILLVAIGVFLYAGFQLFQIFREYKAGEDEYKAIEQMAVTEELVPVVSEKDGLPKQKKVFNVDFAKLKKVNPDVVGWIRFEEPSQISYPLVKGADNEKYLKTTFEGNRNSAGALFLDMNNAGDFSDYNTFIYGHNMKNGSMFGRLRKYKSKSFCEENPYFYIYTPDGMEVKYQVFAATTAPRAIEASLVSALSERETRTMGTLAPTMIPAFWKPMNAINRPIPAGIAFFRHSGRAFATLERRPVREKIRKTIPDTRMITRPA